MFTEIEYWPSRSSFSLCSRLLGGTFKSSTLEAESRYCSLRNAIRQISAGNRFVLPASYSSAVCRSAKVLITCASVNYCVTHGQPPPEYRSQPSSTAPDPCPLWSQIVPIPAETHQTERRICTAASCSIRPNSDTLPAFSFRTIRSICTMAPLCH